MENEKCVECVYYYYPNEKGECLRIPKNHCAAWDSTHCTLCEKYYYPNKDGECEKINLPNCEYLDWDDPDPTQCHECEEDYSLDVNGKFQKNTIEHCQIYESNSKCKSCEYSYHVNKEGKCELSSDHCSQLDENNICQFCDDHYYLDNGECKEITIPNCAYLYWEDLNKCDACVFGYELSEDKTECTKACQETGEVCYDCTMNYYPFDNGKSCHIIDPDLSSNEKDSTDENAYIGLNLFISALILLFIY